MNPTEKLSVLIPWKNRPEIKKTLLANMQFFKEQGINNFEIIIINCGGDYYNLISSINSIPDERLRIIYLNKTAFNKSLCLNIGLSEAKGEYILILDTDVILKEIDFNFIFNSLNLKNFVTIEKVIESQVSTSELDSSTGVLEIANYIEIVNEQNKKITVELSRQGLLAKYRSAPGLLFSQLAHLKALNGFNSELEGWGWEDIDIIVRLQNLGLDRKFNGTVEHLTHKDNERYIKDGFADKHQNEQFNFQLCLLNYRLGLFQGTLSTDCSEWESNIQIINNKSQII